MNGRKEKIMEAAKQLFPEQFEKSSTETVLLCEERSSQMAGKFLEAFREAAAQAVCKREENSGDKIQYLLFSCLHSSIFLGKYLIRIDLMGQGLYNAPPLASSYWDAGDIYCLFERDIGEISGKVRNNVPRIRNYEEDYIRYAYAPYYHRMAKVFIREMLEEMLADGEAPDGSEPEEKQVRILFGEYMGEADLLFTLGEERIYEVFQDICR